MQVLTSIKIPFNVETLSIKYKEEKEFKKWSNSWIKKKRKKKRKVKKNKQIKKP